MTYSACLAAKIEEMWTTGRAPYPVERTLLVCGILWRLFTHSVPPATTAYTGVDASEYAVRRYGRARHIRRGSVGALENAGLEGPYDLVVCADVLHYVPTADARRGLASMHFLSGGVAFIEAFTSADAIQGDHAGFQRRTPAAYRRLFADAGFVPVGLHLYVTRAMARTLVALECGGPTRD